MKFFKKLFKQRKTRIVALATLILFLSGMVYTSFGLRKEVKASDTLLKFDEGYGTSTGDSSGTLSFTVTNALWKTEDLCKAGKCLYFDGTGDLVSITDANSGGNLDFAAADTFTIELWFRHTPTISSQQTLVAKYNSTASGGYKIYLDSTGRLVFAIDDDATWGPDASVTSTGTYVDNKWHFVSATKNGTTSMSIYVDGQMVNQNTSISGVGSLANGDTFYVGMDGNGSSNGFIGFIDEVKVYRSLRSADNIKADFVGTTVTRGTSASFGPNQSYLSDGLVGYWKMDESSWTGDCATDAALDSSGNSNHSHACPNGSAPTATSSAKFGNAANGNGTDSYLYVGDIDNLDMSTGSLTFATWIKITKTATDDNIVIKGGGSSSLVGYEFQVDTSSGGMPTGTGTLRLFISDGSSYIVNTLKGSKDVADNKWHHVAFTWNPKIGAKIYADGVMENQASVTTSVDLDSSDGFYLGGTDTTAFSVSGPMDEVRVYKRDFSPAEVAKLYNWAPGPVGWWKMDEGTGTSVYDLSGNGNTGSFESSMAQDDWVSGKFGKAIDLDGVDDYISVADSESTNIQGSISVSAWVYLHSNTGRNSHIIRKSSSGGYVLTLGSGGTSGFIIYNYFGDYRSVTTTIDANTWVFLEGTYNMDGEAKIYKNGVLMDSDPNIGPLDQSSSTTLRFGYEGWMPSNNYKLDGIVDNIKIYNYERTSAQVIEDMNAGHPAPGSPIGSAIAHWKFDEGYGDTAYDSGSGQYNLDLASTTTACPGSYCPDWTNSGRFGKALNYNGTDDKGAYIGQANNAGLQIAEDLTISAWIYPETFGDQDYIIHMGETGSETEYDNDLYFLRYDTTSGSDIEYGHEYGAGNDEYHVFDTNLSANNWYHIVLTRDIDTKLLSLYINGKLIATKTYTNDPSGGGGADLAIGVNDDMNADYFDGTIDDVYIFNSSFTPEQVNLLYNQGAGASMGVLSTASSSATMTSSARSYCPPGDTGTCNPPVAEWKLDENTGGYTYDSSGNNNIGELSDTPTWTTGKFGSGIQFDGTNSDDRVYCASDTSIDNPAKMTATAWIYPKGLGEGGYGRIFSKWGNNQDGRAFSVYTNNALAYWHGWSTSTNFYAYWTTPSNSINLNQWNHIAVTYDNSSTSNTPVIYINGISQTVTVQQAASGTVGDDSSGSFYLGNRINSSVYDRTFDGTIDDFRYYNYIRTPAQIAWDYNYGKPVGWWRFDEGSGDTANNATDFGSSNNGDLAGSGGSCPGASACPTWTTSGKYNNALDYDSSDDYVNAGSDASIDKIFANSGGSVSAWIKADTFGEGSIGRIADKGGASSSTGWALAVCNDGSNCTNSLLLFVGFSGSNDFWYVTPNNSISTGAWTHVVATYNNTSVDNHPTFYINGVKRNTIEAITSSGSANDDSANSLIIGNRSDFDRTFDGIIDDVRVYNYILTQEQINNIYNESAVRYGPITGTP